MLAPSHIEKFCRESGYPYDLDRFGNYYLQMTGDDKLPSRMVVGQNEGWITLTKSFSLLGRRIVDLDKLSAAIFRISEGFLTSYVGSSGFVYLSGRFPPVENMDEFLDVFIQVCEGFDSALSKMGSESALNEQLFLEILESPSAAQ